MAQNFRLSILPHKRQSYDVSQFSERETQFQDVDEIQNNLLSEHSSNGTSQNVQQLSSASNQVNGPSTMKESIQVHPSKELQKNPKDFWLCIGLISIFTLIAVAGILVVRFGIPSTPKENNATNNSLKVSNWTTTEVDYDTSTSTPVVPSSIDLNETQVNYTNLR